MILGDAECGASAQVGRIDARDRETWDVVEPPRSVTSQNSNITRSQSQVELWCDSRAYVTQGCGGTPLGARVMGDKTGAAASEAMMTVEERVQGADDGEVTMKSEGAGSVPDVH